MQNEPIQRKPFTGQKAVDESYEIGEFSNGLAEVMEKLLERAMQWQNMGGKYKDGHIRDVVHDTFFEATQEARNEYNYGRCSDITPDIDGSLDWAIQALNNWRAFRSMSAAMKKVVPNPAMQGFKVQNYLQDGE